MEFLSKNPNNKKNIVDGGGGLVGRGRCWNK